MSDLVAVMVNGRDIHEWMRFPTVPRRGDILLMGSLTRGVVKADVMVVKVEWVMEQSSSVVYPWVTVRRLPKRDGDEAVTTPAPAPEADRE